MCTSEQYYCLLCCLPSLVHSLKCPLSSLDILDHRSESTAMTIMILICRLTISLCRHKIMYIQKCMYAFWFSLRQYSLPMDLHSRRDIVPLVLTTFKSTIWFVVRTCLYTNWDYPSMHMHTAATKQVVYCTDCTVCEYISRKSHNKIIVLTKSAHSICMMVVHTSTHSLNTTV